MTFDTIDNDSVSGQRIAYGICLRPGTTVSGHFINDVGASLEECSSWIVRRVLRQCPEDERSSDWTVCLWVDGKIAYERRPDRASVACA
jgi:hypothetical protein